MRRCRLAWLTLGATLLLPPAFASEALTTKDLLGRAQTEADRKGGSDLMGRIDAGRRSPAPPEARPAGRPEPSPAGALPLPGPQPATTLQPPPARSDGRPDARPDAP